MLRLVRDASGNLDFASPVQFHLGRMRRKIQDEFTHLPISRQLKYQLRTRRDQRCMEWTSFCLATKTNVPCLIISPSFANKSSGRVLRPGLFLWGRAPQPNGLLVWKGGPLGRGRWGRPSGPGTASPTLGGRARAAKDVKNSSNSFWVQHSFKSRNCLAQFRRQIPNLPNDSFPASKL
jgi:hypothetical protein